MHQDKSESRDSLRRGVPVLSLSIGDAADFHFSQTGPDDMSSMVRLQSGDLLVFGGASRMIFHGVPGLHAGTAPSELRAAPVNMLPGRLSLTFRES
jgi:alkylated DNA repair dioxygenase AlkB